MTPTNPNTSSVSMPGFSPPVEWQQLFDSLTDLIAILDQEANILYVNAVAEKFWGYRREELLGRSCFDFMLPEDHAASVQAITEASGGRQPWEFENRYRHKEGHIVYMVWTGNYISSDGICYATGRDVTTRKQQEAARLQQEQERSRQIRQIEDILERITDAFLMLDQQDVVRYWNAQAEAITGLHRSETIGKSVWECFPYIKGSNYERFYVQLKQSGKPIHFENFSDRRNIWVDVYVYPYEEGISVFFRDITLRKKSEEESRRLSLLARQMSNAVMITDAHERIIWVNDAFTHITGYTFGEAQGKVPSQLLQGPETDSETAAYIREQKRKLEPFTGEIISYRKDGSTYWTHVNCFPIFDDKGALEQFFSIETDITEQKKLQEELDRETARQQKRITAAVIRAQEEERAQVSQELHDNVNQVLTTVKLYTELCLGGIGNREELLHKSMQLLQDSINEIRSLSKRLSAPSLGNIKLKDSISELVEAFRATNRLDFEIVDGVLQEMEVSNELHITIYRILQEHLTNVLKHAAARRVNLRFELVPEGLRMVIVDDGRGFDTSAKRQGIGITNMISRAESLGGQLELYSAPASGCRLQALFPL